MKWTKLAQSFHDAIRAAILDEEEGISEYRRLLDMTDDPEVQNIILEIIEDEEAHLATLKTLLPEEEFEQ